MMLTRPISEKALSLINIPDPASHCGFLRRHFQANYEPAWTRFLVIIYKGS